MRWRVGRVALGHRGGERSLARVRTVPVANGVIDLRADFTDGNRSAFNAFECHNVARKFPAGQLDHARGHHQADKDQPGG
jgi:hypothetical protein